MKRSLFFSVAVLLVVLLALPLLASAEGSHARIVRLSYVQGDVRYAPEFHNDPLTDPKAVWQNAPLNLPIRQGNVLATGQGRAIVEFETGALAFLGPNTTLEFYDLSLDDGAHITRLILRQGSASFHDLSQNGDYFSVTGGDFSVEVSGRATFRLENFDNGSTVTVRSGQVNVIQGDNATPLEKGHTLSVEAGEAKNQTVTQADLPDEFDRWVSNRVQNEQLVSSQTTTGTYPAYSAGYSDLYTYGSWMNVGGINCWRPFGAGFGWSPFDYGNWIFDASMGWSFIGSAPWGWLPYHYGGWIFAPGYGWMWNPGNTFHGKPQPYRPVTAVFVKNGNSLGVVPMNVADKPGKTSSNLTHGIFPVENGTIGKPVTVAGTEKWTLVKSPANTVLAGHSATLVAAPTYVSRTLSPAILPARENSFGRRSSLVYDANEHRFVSANQASTVANSSVPTNELRLAGKNPSLITGQASRGTTVLSSARMSGTVPARAPATPAPARTGGGGGGGYSGRGGSSWGGSGGSSIGGGSRSGGSSSGSSHPSGGGRAH